MTTMVKTKSGSSYFFTEYEGTLRLLHGVTEYLVLEVTTLKLGERMVIRARPFDSQYRLGEEEILIETTQVVSVK